MQTRKMIDLTGDFCTSRSERLSTKGTGKMPKKTFTPEQIVGKLRQIEVLVSQGKTVPLACKEAGVTDQTYYRWRKEYGGLQMEQAKKLKELQKENGQLKRALATLTLEKQVLKDIAEGNF
jgi:transposase-like protein